MYVKYILHIDIFRAGCFLILASSQRKLREYIECLKLNVATKKMQIRVKFKVLPRFSQNVESNITQY